ncbi:MAG: hypothetical protein RI885_2354 [Actinomycetota bacterium]|jgi:hypothetical protein
MDPPRLPQAPQLADALGLQDSAAVAFALRNGEVIVPLLVQPGPAQVRVFRGAESAGFTLLLFSSAENYRAMLPEEHDLQVLTYDRAKLVEFLETHVDSLETAWFDVAGPHPMQADPRELLAALTL